MGGLKGGCVQCGYCCEHVQFTIPDGPAATEWAKARGIEIIHQNGQFMELRIKQHCLNHQPDKSCALHGDKKPLVCQEFPYNMITFWERHGMDSVKSLGDTCGFKYIKDNNNGEV